MTLWLRYKGKVETNLLGSTRPSSWGIEYWRDRLFVNIITYILPVSMVAYVPGMIMCYVSDQPYIAFYDTLVVALVALIAFKSGLELRLRKMIFLFCIYLLAVVLLYYMGSFGPGLLYLLACVIFVSLIYEVRMAWFSVIVNFLICVFFTFAIHFGWVGVAFAEYTAGAWIGVSANQVLLSVIFAVSIHVLVNGLQETIRREQELLQQQRQEGRDLKSAVQKLKMKNEELEQFAYIASHDLQEPLNTISGLVQIIKIEKDKPDPSEFLKGLNFISSSVERLRVLIRGLLEYSRLGATISPQPIHCANTIRNVVHELHAAISGCGARIQILESVENMPEIVACPLNMNQLFQNLISNAIKFRKDEVLPVVQIDVKDVGSSWLFSVTDNGVGIDSYQLDKIFIIFKRAHEQHLYAGTGIGLAFCKKIVELHGGRIWVNSEAGKGSSFYFTISKFLESEKAGQHTGVQMHIDSMQE